MYLYRCKLVVMPKVKEINIGGGCIMMGSHILKGWSKTQSLIALSSGESELYATLRAASEGLGIQSIAKDVGIDLRRRSMGGCISRAWNDQAAWLRQNPSH